MEVKLNHIYKHYKGSYVLTLARLKNCEGEKEIKYINLNGPKAKIRFKPEACWFDRVENTKRYVECCDLEQLHDLIDDKFYWVDE